MEQVLNNTTIEIDNIIKEGDMVIAYVDHQTTTLIKITSGNKFDNRFGTFFHKDIIGKEYGSKVYNHHFHLNPNLFQITSKNGFIYVLRPTPSLLTRSVAHRTQILYHIDVSFVLLKLNLKPGSIVVESGTGSGSLSSAIQAAISPGGHLYTFEFNEERYKKNQEQFMNLKFDNVTILWHDAYNDGFLPKVAEDSYSLSVADAVFLDLPKPWLAIEHANKVLKKGGRICCFSPCIEQVQKTYISLAKDYTDIKTFECILRSYDRSKAHFIPLNDEKILKKRKHGEATEEESNKTSDLKNKSFFSTGSQFTQGHTGFLTFATKYSEQIFGL